MTVVSLMNDLAENAEEAARIYRRIAEEFSEVARAAGAASAMPIDSPVARAVRAHPSLGPRQRELVEHVAAAGGGGTDTGKLARATGMSQPNVHLTLKHMIDRDLIRKDDSVRPQRYFLGTAISEQSGS
ncbi:MAG: hypothetical protein JWO22_1256 [Frankiales bacterium]|nr:hypothetical protein [Frankiales bacterium]